jgi:hypothetical protein
VVYPGMALVLFVLSWNLIGDAVRDIFDPRLRGRGASGPPVRTDIAGKLNRSRYRYGYWLH